MQETWVQSLGWEDALEKEMATHSSILAWEIPQTVKPVCRRVAVCGVASVGHDLATKQQQRGEFTLYKCFLCVSHTHLCACVYVGMYTYVCLYVMKCRRMAANED